MSEIAILLVLLVLSALFSGSETALTALSMARVRSLRKQDHPGAAALYRLKRYPSRMLVTLLVGNNLVNIGASAIATVLAIEWFGKAGPGIAVGVLTLVVLVFGEITPKSLAFRHSETISLRVARPMLAFRWLVFPLVWILERFTDWLHTRAGGQHEPPVTESELISMIEHGEHAGTIEHGERELIERVFAFTHLKVADVMTPRTRVYAIDGSRSVGEALGDLLNETFSRIPLYHEQPHEIRHVVYLRDVLEAVAADRLDAPLREIGREAMYVPQSQPIDELFARLRRKKRHMAVVVDEYGGLQGIVTLEDLLEELVGEIYDESDKTPEGVESLPGDKLAVAGTAELREVEEFFSMDLPGKPTDTVSLWILNRTRRIPRKDEEFTIDGLDVVVQDASVRRIRRVVLCRSQDGRPSGS